VFPVAAAVALDLIRRGEVRDQWLMPSALPKMSTGTLACHLGRQVVRAAELLPAATDVPPLESADAHYHRAAWVMPVSPDDPPNDRSTDDAEAALGAAVLAGRSAGALATVRRLLAAGTARDVVLIPWQGWSLRRDDFLLTRMLEFLHTHSGERTRQNPSHGYRLGPADLSAPTGPANAHIHESVKTRIGKDGSYRERLPGNVVWSDKNWLNLR
jgi:hypothetical protein